MILVVCTANQCRSPLAAAALRGHLARRGVEVSVESAGLSPGGFPATAPTLDAAATLGFDLSAHESRRLDAAVVARAELVVGMERRHVREAVTLEPPAWPRAFTLRELVRRGEEHGGRSAGESLDDWLGRVRRGRRPADLLGGSRLDDITDPTGDPLSDYEATARELDDLTGRLVDLAWPDRVTDGVTRVR